MQPRQSGLQLCIQWLDRDPQHRSVLLDAVLSPACFMDRGPFSSECVWDVCRETGYWEHCAWSCPNRPSGLIVVDPLLKRFGWFSKGGSSEALVWLGEVQARIWDLRYRVGVG